MGKGSSTTTSSTAPNPIATNSYLTTMARASGVGNLPFTPYGGNLTAPINQQQQQGVGAVNQYAGFAQPYYDQARGYATDAATPLTPEQIQQYQSPYTQNVVDSTTNWFNNQNKQQLENVQGNAAMQGALGGDRVGVAQANLAAQQTASQAPIIAGLYDKSYQSGLGVAQQQQQNRSNAAYQIGNIGTAAQNAGLTGANAQLGAGNLLQSNEQQRLNALYQQWQMQQAFPYQQTQWLAGINTGLGSQLGGTSETTAPAPNPWAQVAGPALMAASFLRDGGRVPGFAPGGEVGRTPFSGVAGFIPMMDLTRGRGAPDAPRVGNQPQTDISKAAGRFAGSMANRDWSSPLDISPAGGSAFSPSYIGDSFPMSGPTSGGLGPLYADGGFVRGFAPGGNVDTFADRFGAATDALASGEFDATGANAMGAPSAIAQFPALDPMMTRTGNPTVSDAGLVPLPRSRPDDAPQMADFAPVGEDDQQGQALGFAPQESTGAPFSFAPVAGFAPAPESPPGRAEAKRSGLLGLNIPAELRGPLMTAGLAMMASRSPHLGNAIGEGGLAGVGAYTQHQERALAHEEKRTGLAHQNRRLDIESQKLDEAAKRAQRTLDEQTRHHRATEGFAQTDRDLKQMQPIKVGSDALGREIYGVRDPRSGVFKIIDPATGNFRDPVPQDRIAPGPASPSPAAPAGLGPQTNAGEDDTIPKNAQPVSDPSGRNEEYLKDLEKLDANLPGTIRKLANYEMSPSMLSIKGGHRERILGMVARYAPDYDAAFYPARAAAMKEFIAGGSTSPAAQITSGNTAIQHLGELAQISEKLGGTNNAWILNKPLNWLNANKQAWENNPDLAAYKSSLDRYAEEATKFYRGSGGALADVQRTIDNLSAKTSPAARASAVAQEANLMQSKINALQDRWKTALGGVGGLTAAIKRAGIEDFPITQKKSAEALEQIHGLHKRQGLPAAPIKGFAPGPAGGGAPGGGAGKIPQGAIDKLRANPGSAGQFDAIFGPGASRSVLGP